MTQGTEALTQAEYSVQSTNTVAQAPPGRALGGDQLDYMADMIGELHKLARDGGLETLAGLLALAQVEARRSIASQKLR